MRKINFSFLNKYCKQLDKVAIATTTKGETIVLLFDYIAQVATHEIFLDLTIEHVVFLSSVREGFICERWLP